MKQEYWITPIDKPGVLKTLMIALTGDSQIALEGNLSDCDFSEIEKDSVDESGELHRVNEDNQSDYKIFRLNEKTINSILEQVLPADRLINKIEHIQIQKNNQVQLLIGDYFHNECVSVGPLVSVELLENMKEKKLIEGYQTDAEAKEKYPWFKA